MISAIVAGLVLSTGLEPVSAVQDLMSDAPAIADPEPGVPGGTSGVADPASIVRASPNAIAAPFLEEPASSYTLDRFVQMGLASHPRVAELGAQIQALEGRHLQAGLRPNPIIGYSGQQLFSGGAAEQQGLLVGQLIVRQPKLDWSQQVVCREIDEATQRLAIIQQRVLTDVSLGFYAVLAAQRRCQITQELLELAEKNLETITKLVEAEEFAEVDRLRAELEVQRARLQRNNAENDRLGAWSRLTALVNQPRLMVAEVSGDLDQLRDDFNPEDVLTQLLATSPEVARAVADRERAAAAVQRARVEPLPDINVEAIVQHDNATNGANGVLQISFPVPVRNRNQGGIREAQGELASAEQVIRRVELDLANRLAEALQRYRNARNQVLESTVEGGIVANAEKSLKLITEGYVAGEVGYLELLTAQRVLVEAKLLLAEALANYWTSRIEIEGLLLRDSLSD